MSSCIPVPTPAAAAADEAWTEQEVCELFVKACRALPGVTVFSSNGRHQDPGAPRTPGPLKVLNWAERYLTKSERDAVILWATAEARRDGESVRAFIREMRWGDPSTLYRRRRRGCKKIAVCLSRDAIAKFDFSVPPPLDGAITGRGSRRNKR